MVTDTILKRIILFLFKDFSVNHTITSLSKEFKMSRVGIWKILKKLQKKKLIILSSIGSGKTSAYLVKLNLDNLIIEKSLSLYLAEESLQQQRWKINFVELEKIVDFLIIYGSILNFFRQANDIDIIGIAKKRNFVQIRKIIDKIQKIQTKKIHSINFTNEEFKQELIKSNRALVNAVKGGVVLFGQEKFIQFIKKLKK